VKAQTVREIVVEIAECNVLRSAIVGYGNILPTIAFLSTENIKSCIFALK
jgi:hypothetical protein